MTIRQRGLGMRVLVGIALMVCLGALPDAARATSEEPLSFLDLMRRPLPRTFERVAYGPAPDQFGQLYLPDTNGPYPVIIVIHGGCWLESLPGVNLTSYLAEDLRKSGFAVWNIEYRRLGVPGGGYPGTFRDVAAAIDMLRKVGPEHDLDLDHVSALGHSSGGQLALWAAGRSTIDPISALHSTDPLKIGRVVTLSGIDDLKRFRDEGPSACGGPDIIDTLTGAASRPDEDPFLDTSPAALAPLTARQIIVVAERDFIVPERFGRAYEAQTKERGGDVHLLVLPHSGHFEMIDPTTPEWTAIKDVLKAP